MHHHPDVHSPWADWSEDQVLHVAVAYNNPFRWRTRRELLNQFRRHMAQSPNVDLHVGEIAYGDRPFEVTHHTDCQFRIDSVMWHKENLLNAVIARFPPDWQYGAIIDGDFHMTRHDWALEAVHQLQHHDFVQLFSSYASLSSDHRPFRLAPSFAYNYRNGLGAFKGKGNEANYEKISNDPPYPGAPGGAWAFTRKAFDAVGGLLDTCVLGSGDWHMAFGLIGEQDDHAEMRRAAPGYVNAVHAWQQRAFRAVKGNIGYVENHAVHPFHGSFTNRGYGTRVGLIAKHRLDPSKHIARNWQGLYRWSHEAQPAMIADVQRYFTSRCEDDPSLHGHEKHLV